MELFSCTSPTPDLETGFVPIAMFSSALLLSAHLNAFHLSETIKKFFFLGSVYLSIYFGITRVCFLFFPSKVVEVMFSFFCGDHLGYFRFFLLSWLK